MAFWEELVVLVLGHRGPAAYTAFQESAGGPGLELLDFFLPSAFVLPGSSKEELVAFVATTRETMSIFFARRLQIGSSLTRPDGGGAALHWPIRIMAPPAPDPCCISH